MPLDISHWTLALATLVVLTAISQATLRTTRPGRRTVALYGYASCALAAVSAICAVSDWQRAATRATTAIRIQGQKDRIYVQLLRAIDAAKDMACDPNPPKTNNAQVLAEYSTTRTSCAFYVMMSMRAGRAMDLPELLQAAEMPWPLTSPPRQLWSYPPLGALVTNIRATPPTIEASSSADLSPSEVELGALFPFALAAWLAAASGKVTAELVRQPIGDKT